MASGLSLDHVALPVFDVPATLRFYGETLGLPLVDAASGDDWGGRPWLMMIFGLDDGRTLALCALRGAERPNASGLPAELQHFAFGCAGDQELANWRARLGEQRVEFREEDHGTQRSLYFEDPNGIVLEVTTPASGGGQGQSSRAMAAVRAWLEAPPTLRAP